MMKNQPFYAEGLCFSCTRCSACCRYESGFVFLSRADVSSLAAECQMAYTDFVETYCRWVPFSNTMERLSLKEKAGFDCVFWNSGCEVYHSRPLQCRAFPFWPSILNFRESWEQNKRDCPGMDRGRLHTREEIEALLDAQSSEPALTRKAQIPRR